jgi:hypothetical protein
MGLLVNDGIEWFRKAEISDVCRSIIITVVVLLILVKPKVFTFAL